MVLVCRSVFYEDVDAFGEETEGEKKATEELQLVMMLEPEEADKDDEPCGDSCDSEDLCEEKGLCAEKVL